MSSKYLKEKKAQQLLSWQEAVRHETKQNLQDNIFKSQKAKHEKKKNHSVNFSALQEF